MTHQQQGHRDSSSPAVPARARLTGLVQNTNLFSLLVLISLLVFSVFGWQMAKRHFDHHHYTQFDKESYITEQRVRQRMDYFGDVMRSSMALFIASDEVTPAEFEEFVHSLDIIERHPGIQALGYVRDMDLKPVSNMIKASARIGPCGYADNATNPDGSRPEFRIVALVESLAENRRLINDELLMEPECLKAMRRARDTGRIAASGIIELSRGDRMVRSITLIAPIFTHPLHHYSSTVQERRQGLHGFVFGSFIAEDLFLGIFGERRFAEIDFEVFDGNIAHPQSLIYDDDGTLHATNVNYTPKYTRTVLLDVYGRDWLLYFTAPSGFHQSYDKYLPVIILFAGVITSVLLFLIARMQYRGMRQHREYATLLSYQAAHDDLTKLPNRTELYRRLQQLLDKPDRKFALLMLDLDGFKEVNDTLGHHSGDLLLQQLGPRLQASLGDADLLVRMGGDEFAVIFEAYGSFDLVENRIHEMMKNLRDPFQLEEIQVQIDASAGLVLAPEHGSTSSDLLRRSDLAMYTAKRRNLDFMLYEEEHEGHTPRHLQLLSELSTAIETHQLELYYQPKIRLKDDAIIGVEALVRWNHPEYGFIPPGEFIPQAENSSLIKPLTLWVVETALRQCSAWHARGFEATVAVNISARNLMDQQLPQDIARLVAESGLDPGCLELEITESAIITDTHRAEATLLAMRETGVHLSIDDFGTGFTSIGHLKQLPISSLKIDRTFVSHLETEDNDAIIVHSVIRLAHNLGMTVVAEGVEDGETLITLKVIGADYAQGFHLCRPIPADALTAWMAGRGDHVDSDNAG